jgi:hypothetical protein
VLDLTVLFFFRALLFWIRIFQIIRRCSPSSHSSCIFLYGTKVLALLVQKYLSHIRAVSLNIAQCYLCGIIEDRSVFSFSRTGLVRQESRYRYLCVCVCVCVCVCMCMCVWPWQNYMRSGVAKDSFLFFMTKEPAKRFQWRLLDTFCSNDFQLIHFFLLIFVRVTVRVTADPLQDQLDPCYWGPGGVGFP